MNALATVGFCFKSRDDSSSDSFGLPQSIFLCEKARTIIPVMAVSVELMQVMALMLAEH